MSPSASSAVSRDALGDGGSFEDGISVSPASDMRVERTCALRDKNERKTGVGRHTRGQTMSGIRGRIDTGWAQRRLSDGLSQTSGTLKGFEAVISS